MATYSCADASTTKIFGASLKVIQNTVNFTTHPIDAGKIEIVQVLRIPADTWVLMAFLKVIKRCPANSTVDFGYGGDDDFFGRALRLDSLGSVPAKDVTEEDSTVMIYKDRAPLAGTPLYFENVDTLDLTATTDVANVDITAGIVQVNALIWRV